MLAVTLDSPSTLEVPLMRINRETSTFFADYQPVRLT